MKLKIDKEAEAFYLCLDDSKIVESEEVTPGVVPISMSTRKWLVLKYSIFPSAFPTRIFRMCSLKPRDGVSIPPKDRERYTAYTEPRSWLCDTCEDLER
jgi:hypothetical protein